MSRDRVAAKAVWALAAAGGMAPALRGSPVPVLVVGGLAVGVLMLVAVVASAAVFSRDENRATRAMDVLWMLLTALFPSRDIAIPTVPFRTRSSPRRPNPGAGPVVSGV